MSFFLGLHFPSQPNIAISTLKTSSSRLPRLLAMAFRDSSCHLCRGSGGPTAIDSLHCRDQASFAA
ncbi:hypothetical protein DY000_02033020 [Brassica cretica]|uniref:Uncharacterized protein n=1 Tax=Brassica cretica TaxID=69181 RepID=A0ABQ7DRX9_BRACR|nr:hypothetical protein DY000_02033020 [Brassica cretica]